MRDIDNSGNEESAVPNISPVPLHVAIIMDGNGRWAQQRGMSRLAGHRAGTENIRRIIRTFGNQGVEYLTLYAFSTENWSRPPEEVQGLFSILADVIDRETVNLHEEGIRLKHIGSLEGLPEELQRKVRQAIELTRDNDRMTLNIAFNYGGRADIVQAVQRMIEDGVPAAEVDAERFARYLYTNGTPDPDLIIRTADEMRLSNFLIWQSAYSEYYATPIFWPDFDEAEALKALRAYAGRERRFGGLGPQG